MATSRTEASNKSSSPVAPPAGTTPARKGSENEISIDALRPVTPEQGSSPDVTPAELAASDTREERIARAAYHHAQRRAFEPGGEVEDWLLAEREIDAKQ